VVKTVPFDIVLNFFIGMLVPLVLREGVRAERGILINRFFLAVVLFETFFFLPLGAYLYFFYPDWSLMFFIDPSGLEEGTIKTIGLLALSGYMGAVFCGFALSAWMVRSDRERAAALIVAVLGVGLGVFSLVTFRRLMEVGTYAQWSALPRTTVPFYAHKIGYVVGLYGAAATAALLMMIKTLQRAKLET
jgi:hypothetical protein